MEITLIKRHRRTLILAVLVAVTALLLFALLSAGGKRLATAQAAVHHPAHVANASDPAGNSQAGGPDTTNANDPAGGNSQAGGPDTGGSSETTGDTETGAAEQNLPGGGANDNGTCNGTCVQ
jgi:hypothetical protein